MITDYVAFDLETTGLRPAADRILEIGAVRVEEGVITGIYETLVDHGLPIPEQITKLTGITAEMTKGAPDIRSATEGFLKFAGDSVLLGHNVLFDYGFMKRSALNLGYTFERSGLDTLMIARKALPQLESRSLDKLAAWYQIPEAHHHRALDDALTTARLYERLREEFASALPALFEPMQLHAKVQKECPATSSQKHYLRDLIKYHRINIDAKIDLLTKNEASRIIDGIINQYGRIRN
ncbi:MAG: 3'-5' exonuclease [Lachnospiraceae bacterium]|nr:3'-5' exonuclease [Lachnospiraceae bacterium]